MESYEHAVISSLTGFLLVYILVGLQDLSLFLVYWLYTILVGVLIDLDHFLISTLRDRDLREVRLALSDPKKVLTDNNEALEETISERSRYLSHLLILVLAPYLALNHSVLLAQITFAMLLIHICSDVYGSYREYYIL